MKEQIKNLRIKIDGLAQLVKELKPVSTSKWVNPNEYYIYMDNSQEINKAADSLYLAKAWLGKVLGELGNENPYGSGYKTKEDIVPTQDVANLNPLDPSTSHIELVDWLRTEIGRVIKDMESITWLEQKNNIVTKLNHLFNNTYNHLCEARFWLGFELERIKNN
jgi:hypothetical protein